MNKRLGINKQNKSMVIPENIFSDHFTEECIPNQLNSILYSKW
ncbi:hypothetical protein [Bacillus cereus]|nr:hypothetical protein [Bacillus cereus]